MGWKIGIFPIGPKPISQGEIDFYNHRMIVFQRQTEAAQRKDASGNPDPDKETLWRCVQDPASIVADYMAAGKQMPSDMNPTVAGLSIIQWRKFIRDNPPPRREDFGPV
ncbi:hypothetical protein AGMMS49921_14050 [Endomicrobiia bacterium]|nr:hypothetical protein AGMMS49921_14050 [Endomicrobiia bacterium]